MTDTAVPAAAVDDDAEPVVAERRPKTVRNIAIGVGLVAVVLLAVLVRADGTAEAPSPLLGKLAPVAAGPQVWPVADDGAGDVDLAALRGKWVVVNFFATWCVPCREEHDDLVRFANRHRVAGDAAVVSVLYEDPDHDAVRRFFAEHGGDWPVFEDRNAKVDWGVRGVPESFLVSPDGFVLSRIVGGVQIEGLEDLLRRAKAGAAR